MKYIHEHSSLLECDSVTGQVVTCILQEHSGLIFGVKQSQKMEQPWRWWYWWQSDPASHTGTFQKFLLVTAENKKIVGIQVHAIGTVLKPSHVQTCHLVSKTNWDDLFISSLQRKISKWKFILFILITVTILLPHTSSANIPCTGSLSSSLHLSCHRSHRQGRNATG